MTLCIQHKYIEMCNHQEVEEVEAVVVACPLLSKGRKYLHTQCLLYIVFEFLQQMYRKLGRKLDMKLELFLMHKLRSQVLVAVEAVVVGFHRNL